MGTAIAIYAAFVTALLAIVLSQQLNTRFGVSLRVQLAIELIGQVIDSPGFPVEQKEKLVHVVLLLLAEQEVYGAQKVAQAPMRDVTPKR